MVVADDGQKALAIQMAAYYNNARAGVDKAHNNYAEQVPEMPVETPATKHVVMDTPSMQNVAAAARPLADVSDATCCHVDASDEPGESRSLLESTSDINRRRHYQLDLQTD